MTLLLRTGIFDSTGEGAASHTRFPLAGTLLFLVVALALLFTTGCGLVGKPAAASPTGPAPFQMTTTSVPSGTVQQSYSTTLSATGGVTPYSWSVTSGALPSGLTLNASSGTIAGAPAQAGTFGFTAQVRDSSPSPLTAARALTLIVNSAGLQITTTGLPQGTVGTSYTATLSATGGTTPYSWSVNGGQLPTGLTLSTTGTISGTPTTAGTFTFQVQVRDSAGLTSSSSFSINISSPTACGGPITYCSRTDFGVAQVPSPVPNVGNLTGANTVITDPDFSNRIMRLTDANTDPSNLDITYGSDSSGSADSNVFNTDSTLLVANNVNNRSYVWSFNPATMQAARLYVSSFPSTGGFTPQGNEDQWSRVNSQILYAFVGTQILKYDFTDRANPPTAQLVFDFASNPSCSGMTGGPSDTFVSKGDAAFGTSYNGHIIVVYVPGQGCRKWDTATGAITGSFGTTGTVNIPDRFNLHNIRGGKDGNWVVVVPQGCISSCTAPAQIFWQLAVATVTLCPDANSCNGHWVGGMTHFINNDQNPTGSERIRSFANPSSSSALITSFPPGMSGPLDQHQSWNNVNSTDTTPVCYTTDTITSPFPTAWWNEVLCAATDGSGVVWRFAHSFIDNNSQRFTNAQAIGSNSQDGKFFMFSSDWKGTLGSESGSSACTIGTNCRGDVFIVELR